MSPWNVHSKLMVRRLLGIRNRHRNVNSLYLKLKGKRQVDGDRVKYMLIESNSAGDWCGVIGEH